MGSSNEGKRPVMVVRWEFWRLRRESEIIPDPFRPLLRLSASDISVRQL